MRKGLIPAAGQLTLNKWPAIMDNDCGEDRLPQDPTLLVIDKLYAAALDPSQWEEALDAFAEAIGGFGTVIASVVRSGPLLLCSSSLQAANEVYVRDGWIDRDVLRRRGGELGFPNGVFTDKDILPPDMRRRDAFINDFWRQNKIGAMASYGASPFPDELFAIAVQREAQLGYFTEDALQRLRVLGPHAARAIELSARVAEAEDARRDLEGLVERIDAACIAVTVNRRVLACNKKAATLVGDGIQITRSVVRATISSFDAEIDRIVHSAATHATPETDCTIVPRPSGRPPLLLQAYALPRPSVSALTDAMAVPAVVLTITPPDEADRPEPPKILRRFGLTPTEAQVATAIASGESPSELAERLGVSTHTVRTHLRSCYLKLSVSRQSELSRLISRLTVLK